MLQASQQNLIKMLGPIATLVVGPKQMSDVTLRESTEQEEGALSAETGAPQLNDLGDKSLRGLHNTDPVGQAVHPHVAEVTIGIKPRRHGPKHLAPVRPERL